VKTAEHATPATIQFVSSTAGNILLTYKPGKERLRSKRDLLVVPPFTEEMNKSRRMISLLSDELALGGYGVLVVDLFGTGDSEGDFSDASWNIWKQDLAAAINWIKDQHDSEISILGFRIGAMLALNMISDFGLSLDKFILWQPVVNGKIMMTQFLRLRIAANMMNKEESKETISDLRSMLEQRQSIEVAGYELSPELFSDISNMNLASMRIPEKLSIHWIEIVSNMDQPLARNSQDVLTQWQENGLDVTEHKVAGEPFWSTPEITIVPELIKLTSDVLCEGNTGDI